jgi:hypothetical protein
MQVRVPVAHSSSLREHATVRLSHTSFTHSTIDGPKQFLQLKLGVWKPLVPRQKLKWGMTSPWWCLGVVQIVLKSLLVLLFSLVLDYPKAEGSVCG